MTKPNTRFELSVKDLDIIETALYNKMSRRSRSLTEVYDEIDKRELDEIRDLLGRLHNQKQWYRPKNNYVGG
jgi:hypothetical protein